MKIAISTSGADIEAPYDPRFGRAAQFCIIESETGEWYVFPNLAIHASGGAGVQAAQFVAEKGAEVVISGAYGPNAYDTLEAAQIAAYLAPGGGSFSVAELVQSFKDGQLEQASVASHKGYHSGRRGGA